MKRRDTLILAALVPLLLAGCASTSTPTHWYELKSAPPEASPTARAGDGAVWELSGRMRLPGTLERDTLVVASGAAGVVPLEGHRWVEPLRDSIPVRLAADLALLRGEGLVWLSPTPPGVSVARRLRVEIDTLVADEARQALRLRARWWFTDATPTTSAPTLGTADIQIDLPDRSVDALAAAHRLAIWRLARRITSAP
ncbi:MAG: ABC-type transport auxiliary lipoprotein family protein [Pseudomonadota bacterium]